ncbi:MAG TPA: hypothetical protein VKG24_13685 [Pseudolabrys sp.]|nr:hypothetical protein [Pseudolabrys sp.]
MKTRTFLLVSAMAGALAIGAVDAASAQGMQDRMGPCMMQGSTDQQTMGQGMMQGGRGRGNTDSGMCTMMHGGMGSGTMGQGPGMMGSGMMQGGAGSGMGALFGSRVTPLMNLSAEDVRGYLVSRLDRLNNKRLKIGELKSDDGTITADIVTVDNSLVQRLKIDRHTGTIQYEN